MISMTKFLSQILDFHLKFTISVTYYRTLTLDLPLMIQSHGATLSAIWFKGQTLWYKNAKCKNTCKLFFFHARMESVLGILHKTH